MKFTLTIEATSQEEIAKFLAGSHITGGGTNVVHLTTPVINMAQPANGPAPATDEDDGTVNPNAPAIDATGMPWDERIHSAGKAMTDKGVWRKKRNVDAATVQAVEAVLRAVQQHAASMPAPVAPMPPPTMPYTPPAAPMPPTMPYTPPAAPMPPPVAPVQQQPTFAQPQQADMMDFHTFMQHLSAAMQQGKVDAPYAASIASRFGMTAITDVNVRADLIPFVVATMRAEGRL